MTTTPQIHRPMSSWEQTMFHARVSWALHGIIVQDADRLGGLTATIQEYLWDVWL